jgi:translocation and assembly module TamB
VNLDLNARPGMRLAGELRIDGAATRPLVPLGRLQDINARLGFIDRGLQIQNFTGLLGGEPVTLSGKIDLGDRNLETGLPLLDLKLRGQNVPLVRQPELILRSDLDLRIANATNKPAVVSGTINLRDSVYLSDLKPLIPGKVAKPSRRPPYFSIEVVPLADWRLDLKVRGEQFLKVRSPLFRGAVSANLKVEGTLKEPVALGETIINSGLIQFPFANLRVNQGFVSLTSEDPYRPQLFVIASAKTFGYDVKMEVSGPADEPVIQFSSVPALSSEQIVLMITAGELPRDQLRFSNQQKAGKIALFLGKGLLSKFGSGEGGAERLTIRSGENISEKGKQTYSVEYKLTEDWSIVGEYDRFSEFNAGFKWRFYSK